MEGTSSPPTSQVAYLLIRNIPKAFHSSDLRRFFSSFTETSKFECFHFRHRPEVKQTESGQTKNSRCCLVRVRESLVTEFLNRYQEKHWTDLNHEELQTRCFITKVKVSSEGRSDGNEDNVLSQSDLGKMAELHPPAMMPQGNVGTPTEFFLKAIKECRLPPKVIAKLKLEFPMIRRRRKYGSVPFDYDLSNASTSTSSKSASTPFLHRAKFESKNKTGPEMEKAKDGSGSDDDDDTCEEWERHEALHNDVAARRVDPTDVSQQPGTKERLFEEEMEVVWEKGGSGLVFYTDAQVWKEKEGDFDEQTTDDWDVDMSIYYGAEGDKDAKDSLDMRRSVFKRKGQDVKSVFRRPDEDEPGPSSTKIGKFERHTKGFGRRIMEGQGWKEGQGLGKTYKGISEALENEGQTSKAGLGYHGDRVSTFVTKVKGKQRQSIRDVFISTAFDNPEAIDPAEKVNRTNPQNYLSHRQT